MTCTPKREKSQFSIMAISIDFYVHVVGDFLIIFDFESLAL